MALSDIANVIITQGTKTVSKAGFGTLGLCFFHTAWVGTAVRSYSNIQGVAADFAANTLGYRLAQAAFAQNPSPNKVKIGNRGTGPTMVLSITPTAQGTGFVHSYTVKDSGILTDAISYTEQAADTATDIATGLHAASSSLAVGMTSADATGSQTLTSDTAGDFFAVVDLTSSLALDDGTPDAGIATDLAAMKLADPDFYGLAIPDSDHATNIAAAAWAEANDVIFCPATADSDVLTSSTTDILSALQTAAYARTGGMFCKDAMAFAGAAWLGRMLPTTPGSDTWAFKTLAGVPANTLTSTQEAYVIAKSGNTYLPTAGINITYEGTSAAGEYLDVTRLSDWTKARIVESVYGALASGGPKVPFTNVGGALLGNRVKGPLLQGVKNGGYRKGTPSVFVPDVDDVPANDRAARTWSGITFAATIAGAVHKVPSITGTLSI